MALVRNAWLIVLLVLCGCESSVSGQGSPGDAASQEAAGYTADGDIPGVRTLDSPRTAHTAEDVEYAESPPYGGDHDPVWADCTGTMYPDPVRSENAVHSLEHGAVWVTYSPDLPADDVDSLRALVEGVEYTLMSPYPGLESAVSVQSWARQLPVESADDPLLTAFLRIYRMNPDITPEPGATCSNSDSAASPRGPDS